MTSFRWWIVAALAVTTTAGYGVLSYAFAVFLVPMQHDLGAGRTAITAAQTLSLLAAAVAAVPAGRFLDRHGGRALMVCCSLAATGLVLAWSRVENVLQLYAVSIGLGLATAGVLYEAAFAVVVTWFQDQRRGTAMLAITIVGGFASTIFIPLSGLLVEWYGWRRALVVLALVYGCLTVPLHALVRSPRSPDRVRGRSPRGARRGRRADRAHPPATADRRRTLGMALRDPAYWMIGAAFVTQGVGVFVIGVHLVAYLHELGHSPTVAAGVAGLLGVLSVAGRVATTAAQRRFAVTSVVAVIFVVQAAGLALLPIAGRDLIGAVACVLAVGLGFGVSTIARPAMVAERYGVADYATLAGLLAAFLMVSKALTPLGAAWLRTTSGSYTPVMAICALTSLVGAFALVLVGRRPARQPDGRGGGDEAEQARAGEGEGVAAHVVPDHPGGGGRDGGAELVGGEDPAEDDRPGRSEVRTAQGDGRRHRGHPVQAVEHDEDQQARVRGGVQQRGQQEQ
ncbi:MFS family permease [Actinopolymorpha pittospori]|uniref:MFS family permease n=1 Tax=Actinopolymorpha pittospori TaxID=648752 RepID=A0A927R9J9_9ACTN|nr:MFS family permease [Actinopolymorpha pittospori]